MRLVHQISQRNAAKARHSRAFRDHLRSPRRPDGERAWSDRTVHRMMTHRKRFARWVHSVAVQRQLGHRNTVYSMQYSRVTDQELHYALEEG